MVYAEAMSKPRTVMLLILYPLVSIGATAEAGTMITYRISGAVDQVIHRTDPQFGNVVVGTEVWFDLVIDTTTTASFPDEGQMQWGYLTSLSSFHLGPRTYGLRDEEGWDSYRYTNTDLVDSFVAVAEIDDKDTTGHMLVEIDLDKSFLPGSSLFDLTPLSGGEIGPIVNSDGYFDFGSPGLGLNLHWEITGFTRVPSPGSLTAFGVLGLVVTRRRRINGA